MAVAGRCCLSGRSEYRVLERVAPGQRESYLPQMRVDSRMGEVDGEPEPGLTEELQGQLDRLKQGDPSLLMPLARK